MCPSGVRPLDRLYALCSRGAGRRPPDPGSGGCALHAGPPSRCHRAWRWCRPDHDRDAGRRRQRADRERRGLEVCVHRPASVLVWWRPRLTSAIALVPAGFASRRHRRFAFVWCSRLTVDRTIAVGRVWERTHEHQRADEAKCIGSAREFLAEATGEDPGCRTFSSVRGQPRVWTNVGRPRVALAGRRWHDAAMDQRALGTRRQPPLDP
jgi:hypothetical protein